MRRNEPGKGPAGSGRGSCRAFRSRGPVPIQVTLPIVALGVLLSVPAEPPQRAAVVTTVAAMVVAVLRIPRLSVCETEVVLRGLFGAVRIPLREVEDVSVEPTIFFLTRPVAVLVVRTGTGSVPFRWIARSDARRHFLYGDALSRTRDEQQKRIERIRDAVRERQHGGE
jgi:hypothetical protein